MELKKPRMLGFIIFAVLLIAYLADYSPQQIPVVIYKTALVILATPIALYIDRSLFRDMLGGFEKSAGPADFGRASVLHTNLYAARMIARAIVYLTVVGGITLAL